MRKQKTLSKLAAMAMSCFLAAAPLAMAGGGAALAKPDYSPKPKETANYEDTASWLDYTPPASLTDPEVYLYDSITIDNEDNVYAAGLSYGGSGGSGPVYDGGAILKFSKDGSTYTKLSDSLPGFGYSFGIHVDADGNLYATENSTPMTSSTGNEARIFKLPAGSGIWEDITHDANDSADMVYAAGITADPFGNLYVVDTEPDSNLEVSRARILKLESGGTNWINIADDSIIRPFDIASDGEGNLFVTQLPSTLSDAQIFKLPVGGSEWIDVTPSGHPVAGYFGLGIDPFDNVYVVDFNANGQVFRLPYNGTSDSWEAITIEALPMVLPSVIYDVAADSSGYLYGAGFLNGAITKLQTVIIYDGNGNTGGSVPATAAYWPDEEAVVSGNTGGLAKGDKKFGGWNTKPDGSGTAYAPGAKIAMTSNVTLYAVWRDALTFTVTYAAAEGGSIDGTGVETVVEDGYPSAVPAVIPDDGYTFLGWSADGGTTLLTAEQVAQTAVTGNVTYTAYFQPPAYMTGIELDSESYSLHIGDTHQTVTFAVYSDQSTVPLSDGVTYSSGNEAVAAVSGTGLVAAVGAGETVITAVYGSFQAQAVVTVLPKDEEEPEDPGHSPGQQTGGTSETSDDSIEIIVDGERLDQLATAKKETVDGNSVLTVTLDSRKVIEKVERDNNKQLVIPVTGDYHTVVGELTGELVKSLQSLDAEVQLVTDTAAYTLPASLIDIDGIAAGFGSGVKLEDLTIQIRISAASDEDKERVQEAARNGEFEMIADPVEFEVTVSYGSETVHAGTFSGYVERKIALPEGTDAGGITTGVLLTEDGELIHVPTKIEVQDGKPYAVINSLTNSTYSVIYNPRVMADTSGHWASADVNDMSSRLVVQGVAPGEFRPDAPVTRAEFASIVVRGLGLQESEYANAFSDVGARAWYAGAIQTAVDYGLVKGHEDGFFRPNRNISRQEAAAVLHRAMSIAKLPAEWSALEADRILSAFADGAATADWAKAHVAASVKHGLMKGRDGALDLDAELTRAETAALVRRFLQAADLIN